MRVAAEQSAVLFGAGSCHIPAARLRGCPADGNGEIMRDPHSYLMWSLDGAVVVSPPAEIDITNADQLRAALLSALSASRKRPAVVVDMCQTVFCDSAGLQVLVRAHNRARADRGELRLVIATTPVLHILALRASTGCCGSLPPCPTPWPPGPYRPRPRSSGRPLMTGPALRTPPQYCWLRRPPRELLRTREASGLRRGSAAACRRRR